MYTVKHWDDMHPRIDIVSNAGQPLFEWFVTSGDYPLVIVGDELTARLLAVYFNSLED